MSHRQLFANVPPAPFILFTVFSQPQARNQGGARGGRPIKNISPPLEKCVGHRLKLLDIVQKIWAPPRKLFAPPGVPSLFRTCSIDSYDSWPQVRNKDRFENWQLFGLGKLPFRNDGAIKLTQNCICFTNPCINLFVPTSAQSGRKHQIESNNTKHRNNYFTWGRIMFWMLTCASIRWYHLFSQISREWQLGYSTKVTVYASCRGGLFIVPWFSE